MTWPGLLLVLAATVAVAGPATLPEGEARWRMELGGVPVGAVTLSIRCEGPACEATWSSRQRLPAETGGAERERRITVPVDRSGRATGPAVLLEEGARREVALPRGAVPGLLAEVVLLRAARAGPARSVAPETCLDVADEASGVAARACVRREAPAGAPARAPARARELGPSGKRPAREAGPVLLLRRGGATERLVPGPGGFPAEVALQAQGVRFVLDPAASVPASPPRLYGAAVPGPEDPRDGASFCGVRADRAGEAVAGLPAPEAEGASCREKTAAWLVRARAAGLAGRTAVGVAWDGGGWLWHAWAEVSLGGRWVAIDPSFRQAPARGPRFTLASYAEGDEAGRQAAGRKLLACWGRARVEGTAQP